MKSHFSAIQCFLEIADSVISTTRRDNNSTNDPEQNPINTSHSNAPVCLPTKLAPNQFALIGVLGLLSNFPQTGRHLKHVFRLHALGDPSSGDVASGYGFAYQRCREFAVNWKAARKCAYREREILRAKKIIRAVDDTVRHRLVRPKGKRVKEGAVGDAIGDAIGNAIGDIIVVGGQTCGSLADEESRIDTPMDVYSEAAGNDDNAPYPPKSPSTTAFPAPRTPSPPIPITPLASLAPPSLRLSFVVLGALFSACQQPNRIERRPWEIPLDVQQTLPTVRNGRLYSTFQVFYKARRVEGVVLLQIDESRPKVNFKNCPFGCVKVDLSHQWFSSSKYQSLPILQGLMSGILPPSSPLSLSFAISLPLAPYCLVHAILP